MDFFGGGAPGSWNRILRTPDSVPPYLALEVVGLILPRFPSFIHPWIWKNLYIFQENFIAGAFHDGVMLYAQAVNETLAQGGFPGNGTAITLQMRNRTYYGQYPCRNIF